MYRLYLTILFLITLSLFITGHIFASTINQTPPSTVNLNSGLIGWWTFDGADTGSTYTIDKSGAGNTGTRNGGVAVTTGKIGQAMKFDGSTGYIRTPAINLGSNFTIGFWMKPSLLHNYGDAVSAGTTDCNLTFYTAADGHMIFVTGNGVLWGNGVTTAAGVLVNNKWSYVVGTASGGNIELFVNGVSVGQAANSNSLNQVLNIGARTIQSYYFNGTIDDVRVFTRALSAKEIQQLYQMGGGKISQTPPATVNLNSGLVGWWTFDGANTWSTTTTDKSGNGNNGGRYGGVAVTPGKIGQAMKFNGSTGYVQIANNQSLDFTSAFTLSAWVKPNQIRNFMPILVRGEGNTDDIEWYSGVVGVYLVINRGNGGTQEASAALTNPTVGKWNYLVINYDGTNYRYYIDGILKTGPTAIQAPLDTDRRWRIGWVENSVFGSNNKWDGSIDDVRVYNRALSAREIQQLYQMGGGKISQTPPATVNLNSGLVGWWTFDGANTWSTTTTDKSGNGNNGGRYGGVAVTPGKLGQAMKFSGTNWITLSSNVNFSASGATLSLWFKPKVIAEMALVGKLSDEDTYVILENATTIYVQTDIATTVKTFTVPTMSVNNWYHLIVTRNNNTTRVYLNGVESTSGGQSQTDVMTINQIGRYSAYTSLDAWNGLMDDVRIYNRALSTREIQQLYMMGK